MLMIQATQQSSEDTLIVVLQTAIARDVIQIKSSPIYTVYIVIFLKKSTYAAGNKPVLPA